MNINNINIISKKLSEILLFKDFDDIDEKEIIVMNNIFRNISNEKCGLYLYHEICTKINNILLNDNKNYINQKEIIIKIIIQEVYKRINDWKYFNTTKVKSENQHIEIINQIFGLINFIFELIEAKLITKDESYTIIQELINEYQKYERKIKYIFLQGSIYLSDYYFNNLEILKIKEGNLIGSLFCNKLKLVLKDIYFSNNLKLQSILETFLENPQKDDIHYLNSEIKNKNKKNMYKISDNIIKKLRNNRLNKANNNNYTSQDDNGGIQNKIIDGNNYEEVSFKNNKNQKSDNNILNTEYKNNTSSNNRNISGKKANNNNISLINNNIYDLKKNLEYNKIALKKKIKTKKNSKSPENNFVDKDNQNYNIMISEKEKVIYDAIQNDIDDYFNFLLKKGIKTKNDLFIDINYSYNWKLIDDLIVGKKLKLEDIIKIIIEICKNNNNIKTNDIFKINEYLKTIIEYYSNNFTENQFNIFHLNMIEIFLGIDDIVNNNDHSEIMFEIMGNILFILLKNKLYYIKDLNSFINKKIETQINFCKVVKYAIISSGTLSKQYTNDFRYTKLFNKSELFEKYVLNEL